MLLAIDVGNTNIVIGGIENGKSVFSARIQTNREYTADEYALTISGILQMNHVDIANVDGGILSSVVPSLRTVIPKAMKTLTGKDILIVNTGIKTGLNIRMDDPATVGSDLIVSAVAAKAKYKAPIAIIDMGTATTVCLIDKKGDYTGGMIIPGLWISLNALSQRAAQLPHIDLTGQTELFGKNTIDCMRSGSLIGTASMLDGILDRIEEEVGEPVSAVITGGLSTLVLPYCKHEIHSEPDLIIDGLCMLYDKNTKKPRSKK